MKKLQALLALFACTLLPLNAASLETTIVGGGTIEGAGSFPDGTSITLTTIPDAGWVFIAWTGDASGSDNPLTLTVDGDMNVGALFIEPAAYGLVTQDNYNTVVAERDALLADIQLAFDRVNTAAGVTDADLLPVEEPENAPSEAQNEGVIARAFQAFQINTFDVQRRVDTELALYGSDGNLIAQNDDAQESALPPGVFDYASQLDFPDGLADGIYYLAAGTYNSTFGETDFEASTTSGSRNYTLNIPSINSLGILRQRSILGTFRFRTIDWYRIEIGRNFNVVQLEPLTQMFSNLIEDRGSAIAERDAAIAERDARPTVDQLAAVEAERDARFTEDQIRAMSADYTIGLNNAGNVQMKFNLFESADLNTFAPLTLNPDSVSVVDGSICLEFAPEDSAAFFRFSVE